MKAESTEPSCLGDISTEKPKASILGAQGFEALCELPTWIRQEQGEVEILGETVEAIEEPE